MTETALPNATDVLHRAAEVIERDGWIQRCTMTDDGVCAYGGLIRATKELLGLPAHTKQRTWPAEAERVYNEAADRLRLHINYPFLSDWNDKPERTQGQVVAAMRQAAKDAGS